MIFGYLFEEIVPIAQLLDLVQKFAFLCHFKFLVSMDRNTQLLRILILTCVDSNRSLHKNYNMLRLEFNLTTSHCSAHLSTVVVVNARIQFRHFTLRSRAMDRTGWVRGVEVGSRNASTGVEPRRF